MNLPNLEITVLVEQDVRWLEIPVNDVRRMQVLESAKHLVDEVLHVLDLQLLLRSYHSIEVGLHQLAYKVNLSKWLPKSNLTS